MQKPKPKTVAKHVQILERLAKKNHGKVPSYTWLDRHGYFRTYEVMRGVPRAFKHLKRVVLA
jgi:hypothetical protein